MEKETTDINIRESELHDPVDTWAASDETDLWGPQPEVSSPASDEPDSLLRKMISVEMRRGTQADDSITIGLWPYGNTTPDTQDEAKRQKDQIEHLVGFYVLAWVGVLCWQFLHGGFFNLLINFKAFFALTLIPFFTMLKGCTHLKVHYGGLELISMNVVDKKVRKRVYWSNVTRVYLDGKSKPTVLDQSICFEQQNGKVLRVKLRKIANRNQWSKLLEGLEKWSGLDISQIDRNIFDSVSPDRTSPTYTMLWLETLAAPPRRERMNPLTEGTLLSQGRYKLVRKLGAGGQGSAFLASSLEDGSQVVLKEYILPIYVDIKARKQALERFEHEAKILTNLNHPSIVKLIDYFIDDHRAYLVLEYIDGDNLQRMVEKNGPVANELACRYAKSLVEILAYLHGQSPPVVHRDFTPDNLIVANDGTIKLIDFMVAQQEDSEQRPTTTTVGTVVGKHSYMAPEQFRGQNRPQSDIYALGCTLYYLLTGLEPEPITQLHPLLQNDSCHPIFNDIVSKCTEANAQDRYSSVEQIREELNTIENDLRPVQV